MADKKISALTGATTPLAGTEVLPIVQGGVTVKVAVSDLTAGRSVTALSYNGNTISTGTGTLTLAAAKVLTASNTLTLAGTDSTTMTFPTTSATIARTDVGQTFTGDQTITSASGNTTLAITGNGAFTSILSLDGSSAGAVSAVKNLRLNAATASTVTLEVNNTAVATTSSTGIAVTGVLSATGVVTFSNYGAGSATFSTAGVISSVSDETWKIKDGAPVDPDAMLKKLEPGYWYYNDEKKETFGVDRQLGFYAQNVNAAIGPEAAPTPETVISKAEDGTDIVTTKPWGYYDRSVLAVTVMSLQRALATIESLTARIAVLEAKR